MRMDKLFVNAIEAIYAAAPEPSRWPVALQAIADCFGDVGANLIWRRDDGGFGNIVSPKLKAASEDYEKNEWWRHDIRAIRAHEYAFRQHEGALADRHIATPEEIDNLPIYTQFLARHGLRWTAGVAISPDPAVSVAICVQRSSAKPPYADAELDTLAHIGRHAESSLRLGIRLLDAELTKAGLGDALARLNVGVFALDSLGRVVFANPAGEALLGGGLALVNRRLLPGIAFERSAFETTVNRMIAAKPEDIALEPSPILIHRQKTDRPLVLYVLPIVRSSHPTAQFLTHARVIVLAIDPEAGALPNPAVVRDVLGLTLGEARVAALVGSGVAPREAAEKLGIAEETARTALKRVFSKTGVSRQSELVALLTKLVLK